MRRQLAFDGTGSAWRALLGAAAMALGLPALAAPPEVVVDPGESLGPVSRVFRPSAMLSFADGEALRAFIGLPGTLGTVRFSLESAITESASLDEYLARLDRITPKLAQLEERGAQIVLVVARTPRWLASTKDQTLVNTYGFTKSEASPPRDLRGYAQFIGDTVRLINGKYHLSPWYEFWNEPDGDGFWVGTQEDLFKLYNEFARAARRADPKARVGGFAVSGWNGRRAGAAVPILEAALTAAGRKDGPALDFVSWHNFGKFPEEGWAVAESGLHRWISSAGLPATFPQIVTEWNRWATFPEWNDKSREGALGAANFIASLHAMDRTGITMQTFAALQDFNAPPRGQAFVGDFGLVTREPMLKKASFYALGMLTQLEPDRIKATVPGAATDAQGVDVLATGSRRKMVILVSRFANDPAGSAIRSLRSVLLDPNSGFAGIKREQVMAYMQGKSDLAQLNLPPATRDALARARDSYEQARAPAGDLTLAISIRGEPGPFRYRLYLIDRDHADPAAAYEAARAKGQSYDQAVAAAREQTPKVVASGTGALPELRLQPYAVALLLVEPATGK